MPEDIKPSQAPPPEEPPQFTEFVKWLGYHLRKDWPTMKKAPLGCSALFAFTVFLCWLFIWQVIVPEKNEQLATKQGIIDRKQADNDSLAKQLEASEKVAEKLKNENASLVANHDEKEFPLKRRVQILASDFKKFASKIPPITDWQRRQDCRSEWENRLYPRLTANLKQMDELGQHSDFFETNNLYFFLGNYTDNESNVVVYASKELENLAAGLP